MEQLTAISNLDKNQKSSGLVFGQTNQSYFFKPLIQPKLIINQPNDIYEQEADAIADKVMRMPDPATSDNLFFKPSISAIQRKCAHCEEEEKRIQRKVSSNDATVASAQTENYINTLSGGRTLNEKEKSFFEPRMDYNFSDVKIHTSSDAAKSAQSINALAYTAGNDIVFNEGQYSPDTDSGKRLLGHELAHVIQQQPESHPKKIQAKVVDDDDHLPCRATAGRDAATLTARENEAAAMAQTAATILRARPLSELARQLLWKRFRLDYNDTLARCRYLPTIADRFQRIADTIRNTEVTYRCTATGEPISDCSTALAVTQLGIFYIGLDFALCSTFWPQSDPEKAASLLHEWAHFNFASRGVHDELPGGFDTAECYNAFATEVSGGAITGPEDTNCVPNPTPLPPLNQTLIDRVPCPGNVFLNVTGTAGYAYGMPGRSHYFTTELGLDYLFPLTRMHDWELSVGPRLTNFRPVREEDSAALAIGARVGLQFRYRPWRFGWQLGGYAEAGGINVTESGRDITHPYVGGGVTGGLSIPLGRQTALQIFVDVGGRAGLDTGDSRQFDWFQTGIGVALQAQ